LNVEKVDNLVSPGVRWAVEQGMDMAIVPYKFIGEPKAYKEPRKNTRPRHSSTMTAH
jgi:hypothetical protein